MRQRNELQENLNVDDICLMRYNIGTEKKSLLATVLEIDEFSEYHPIKLVCKLDSDELLMPEEGIPVSLVIKKQDLLLYVLLKGSVFRKDTNSGYVVLSITDVQFFAREVNNKISSFKKLKHSTVLSAA